MPLIQIDRKMDTLYLTYQDKKLGEVHLSYNPYHGQHTYLNFQLVDYPPQLARPIIKAIKRVIPDSYQVMISSHEEQIIAFLRAAGFSCLRSCTEVEATSADYLGNLADPPSPATCSYGSPIFQQASRCMLQHYQLTHESINPWTGKQTDFYTQLPHHLYYEMEENGTVLLNGAFIAGNEIAYVYGQSPQTFLPFAQRVVSQLLQTQDTICFEADNVDPIATSLLSLFRLPDKPRWETYILSS